MEMDINEKIKQKRLECKLSQYNFAKKTKKLNQSQISKIEQGNRKITTEDLISIANALGVTVNELIGEGSD